MEGEKESRTKAAQVIATDHYLPNLKDKFFCRRAQVLGAVWSNRIDILVARLLVQHLFCSA